MAGSRNPGSLGRDPSGPSTGTHSALANKCTTQSESLPSQLENLKLPETFVKPIQLKGWPKSLTWANYQQVPKPIKRPQTHGLIALFDSTEFNTAYTCVSVTPTRDITRTALGAYRLKDLAVTVDLDAPNTWVVQGKATPALLAHEQGHYNITGLIARELHWRLDQLWSRDPCQLDRWVSATMNLVWKKHARVYVKYDADTSHGDNQIGQKRWDELISSCTKENKPLPE